MMRVLPIPVAPNSRKPGIDGYFTSDAYKLVESRKFEITERVVLIFVMSARGPAVIRNINRFDVLQTIRLHDNQISRSELSEMTGLSQATISSIVGHLIGEGALIE